MDERNENDKLDEIMLPPGFRFYPTDEELLGFYLRRKIQQRPLAIEPIEQIGMYKYDPWDLPKCDQSLTGSVGHSTWETYNSRPKLYSRKYGVLGGHRASRRWWAAGKTADTALFYNEAAYADAVRRKRNQPICGESLPDFPSTALHGFRSWQFERSLQNGGKAGNQVQNGTEELANCKLRSSDGGSSLKLADAVGKKLKPIYGGSHPKCQSMRPYYDGEAAFRSWHLGESSQNHSGTGKVSICKKKFLDGESSQQLQLPIVILKAEGPVNVSKQGKTICGGSHLDEFVCVSNYDEATAFRSQQLDGESSQEHTIIQVDHDSASSIGLASTPLNENASSSDSNHQSLRASASPSEDRDVESRVALSQAQSMREESPFDFDKLNKIILLLSTEECLALLAILFSGSSSLSTNARILMRGAGISCAVGFYSSLGSSILKHIGKSEPAAPFLTALGGVAAACGFTFLSCLFLPQKLMLIFAGVICIMNIFILPFLFIKKN
ncbi:hypothetical protein CICLE_v10019845mg [Citrus x clementina]|uniref:Uncharacterized protein n=2 Tax=Citrus TaxID=2706 RepID=A0ACB8MBW7_CITSI|nr:hypothetical protein CICLE_v10019845mg [Citrus x clementina]KAH9783378.1 hypothetical protein KPL71_009288 [Citrus sinensis]